MKIEMEMQNKKLKSLSAGKDTIPIIVDNIIDLPLYNMVRFVYFSIDCSDTPKNFALKIGRRIIPVWLSEFQGIIHRPLSGKVFRSPRAIDRLFNTVDDSGEYFIDTNDIWIPREMFSLNPSRGDVYRISRGLFSLALKYRNEKIEKDLYIKLAGELSTGLNYTATETSAFSKWSLLKIKEAMNLYPKNSEMQLSYIDTV